MGLEGRYTVVKKVADGGMAEIFLARLTGAQGFERLVILKRILPDFSADPHFRNMIVDEAHIAMSLHHGNIVQVLDLGETDGRYFLVLELVDGWDLATVIMRAADARLPVPPGLSLYIVAQVCRALAYAHGQTRNGKPLGIVHRDISPQNVLISEQGEVKLTDFGIAKALGKRERTQTGVIKGKLDFMSPEQAAGSVLDPRSDIFSVGTLLYVLTTGKRPFEADGQLETLIRVQNAQFTAPEQVVPGLSPKIAAIINKAMRKTPSERHDSAEEVMRDVEEILRADFQSVGQSELKGYLDKLGHKDHVPPISRAPGLPQEEDELDLEETRPEQRTPGTLAMGRPVRIPTIAIEPTQQRPDPVGAAGAVPVAAAGAYPASRLPDDSTDFVPRVPVRRVGAGTLGVAAVLLAGLAGLLYFVEPQTGRKLLDQGRQQLARTGLPLPGPIKPPPPPVAKTPEAARPVEHAPEGGPRRDAAPAHTVVTLRLTSRPSGAIVRNKNGAVLGSTPLSLSLKPGSTQRLTFTKHGYASLSRKLIVADADDTFSVELARQSARRPRRR
jgi:serine/threonine-protein kinase